METAFATAGSERWLQIAVDRQLAALNDPLLDCSSCARIDRRRCPLREDRF
jgi:hypothetical protein